MNDSKSILLMSKLGKKKPNTIDEVPAQDLNTVDKTGVLPVKGSINKTGSSLDLIKATKALSPSMMGTVDTISGANDVPSTDKSYSPIKEYLKKRKP